MIFYLSCITIFSTVVLILSMSENFSSPENRSLRGILYTSLGLSASLPLLHLLFFGSTIDGRIGDPTIVNWLLGGMMYIIGVVIYTLRFPEKIWPGKFCIWGSSHQIWHCLVFAAILFHFFACLDTYYDRMNMRNPVGYCK